MNILWITMDLSLTFACFEVLWDKTAEFSLFFYILASILSLRQTLRHKNVKECYEWKHSIVLESLLFKNVKQEKIKIRFMTHYLAQILFQDSF